MSDKHKEPMVTITIPLKEAEVIGKLDGKAYGGPGGCYQAMRQCREAVKAHKSLYEEWLELFNDLEEDDFMGWGDPGLNLFINAPALVDAVVEAGSLTPRVICVLERALGRDILKELLGHT